MELAALSGPYRLHLLTDRNRVVQERRRIRVVFCLCVVAREVFGVIKQKNGETVNPTEGF